MGDGQEDRSPLAEAIDEALEELGARMDAEGS